MSPPAVSGAPLEPSAPRPSALVVFYVAYFASVGVTLPFMPQYFSSLGLPTSQIGVLLAVGPAFALFVPPLWGQLADRTGRPGLVLLTVSAGGLGGYALLTQVTTFPLVLAALALSQAFAASITTLIDTLALHQVAAKGGSYARIRTWGSFGFVVSSLAFGFVVKVIDRTTVYVAIGLMALYTAWCAIALARAPAMKFAGPRPSFGAAWSLLKRKEVALFLLASCLHWIGCAPYHGILSIHFTKVGLAPWVVSLSTAVAVSSELVALLTWSRWSHRVSPRNVLLAAFLASALRWWGMAATDSPPLLAALSVIHGLTFGAFYVAAVGFMAKCAPASLRATGQSLFVAGTFGVGGLVGFLGTGAAYEALGGHKLFVVAGVIELLPALVVLWTGREERRTASA